MKSDSAITNFVKKDNSVITDSRDLCLRKISNEGSQKSDNISLKSDDLIQNGEGVPPSYSDAMLLGLKNKNKKTKKRLAPH